MSYVSCREWMDSELGTGVYDSDTLAEIDYIPKNMVVQGGGIIGPR